MRICMLLAIMRRLCLTANEKAAKGVRHCSPLLDSFVKPFFTLTGAFKLSIGHILLVS